MPPIPSPEESDGSSQRVPVTAPLISQEEESPEILPYKISFARYRDDECEMISMTPENAKATLTILRDVGINFMDQITYQSRARSNFEIKPVIRDGDYTILFKGLVDEEIHEIKCKKERKDVDVRLFYFAIQKEQIFYLVAAKQSHIDTSKGTNKGGGKRKRKYH